MAITYKSHPDAIGNFEGVGHLLKLLDLCPDAALRHRILLLLRVLMMNDENATMLIRCVAVVYMFVAVTVANI